MPITYPATRDQVLVPLMGRISNIKKASGYRYDIAAWDRNRQQWYKLVTGGNIGYPFALINDGESEVDHVTRDLAYTTLRLSCIVGIRITSQMLASNIQLGTAISQWLEDVTKAILSDPFQTDSNGNRLAFSTRVLTADVADGFNSRTQDAVGEIVVEIDFLEQLIPVPPLTAVPVSYPAGQANNPREDAVAVVEALIRAGAAPVLKTILRTNNQPIISARYISADLPLCAIGQPKDEDTEYLGSFRKETRYLVPVWVYIIDSDDTSGGQVSLTPVLQRVNNALHAEHWPPVSSSRVMSLSVKRAFQVVDKFPLIGYQINVEPKLNYNFRNP